MGVYSEMIEDEWEHQVAYASSRKKSLQSELVSLDKEVDKLVERIMEFDEPRVIKAFQSKIKNKEDAKLVIKEKLANCGRPIKGFDETYRTAMEFLKNPHSYWASGELEYQRTVLKLAFTDRLTYARGEGYRTAKTALPFKFFRGDTEEDKTPESGANKGVEVFLPQEETPSIEGVSDTQIPESEWMVPGPHLQ